ncbi:MAG: endonuclease [Desulfovibrio sp.]|nr:endonuclease [Desulfovibrio sp.]
MIQQTISRTRFLLRSCTIPLLLLCFPITALGDGNETISSYSEAKRIFDSIHQQHRRTVYCGFSYSKTRDVELPDEFPLTPFPTRAQKMEREHIVPVENFGKAFPEWRNGSPMCVDNHGRAYSGRRCAQMASARFRLMEADLHNIFPSVGSVNAARRNFNFEELDGKGRQVFGPSCPVLFSGRKVEPPARAKGIVARAYLYMDQSYPEYHMSRRQKRLMEVWNATYPPDEWECRRNTMIRERQGNGNSFIEKACTDAFSTSSFHNGDPGAQQKD